MIKLKRSLSFRIIKYLLKFFSQFSANTQLQYVKLLK